MNLKHGTVRKLCIINTNILNNGKNINLSHLRRSLGRCKYNISANIIFSDNLSLE